MAKGRGKAKRKSDEDEEDDVIEAEPFEDEEKEYDKAEHSEAAPSGKGFFQQIGDGLKAAGEAAGRYTRIGLLSAELEKHRLELKSAYSRLGEKVAGCWDAAPDIGVTASDSDVKEHVKKIKAIRREIREVQAKIQTLKQNPETTEK
jgi:hypothetical protein